MLRKLFNRVGGERQRSAAEDAPPEVGARETYKDYELRSTPIREDRYWRVAGEIARGEADAEQTHRFIRADTCVDYDDAVDMSLRKARQIVDEHGTALFADSP